MNHHGGRRGSAKKTLSAPASLYRLLGGLAAAGGIRETVSARGNSTRLVTFEKIGMEDRLREREIRAAEFARRLKATGLAVGEFQRRSGLSRNVIYNLSRGQKPSSQEQAELLEEAFTKFARNQEEG